MNQCDTQCGCTRCGGFSNAKSLLVLIGRILIAAVFISGGVDKVLNFSAFANDFATLNIPYGKWLLMLFILLELGGGLMVLLGWFTRLGAVLLLIFGLLGVFVIQSFWTIIPPAGINVKHFILTHLGDLGGLFYVLIYGPGNYSFDAGAARRKRVKESELL
jgi:putative oxidoreductase